MSNVLVSVDYTYIDFKVLQRLKYAHCNNSRQWSVMVQAKCLSDSYTLQISNTLKTLEFLPSCSQVKYNENVPGRIVQKWLLLFPFLNNLSSLTSHCNGSLSSRAFFEVSFYRQTNYVFFIFVFSISGFQIRIQVSNLHGQCCSACWDNLCTDDVFFKSKKEHVIISPRLSVVFF